MNIGEKIQHNVAVLELDGKFTTEEEATTFRSAVHGLIRRNLQHVVVDLGRVEYISSKGLGTIMGAMSSLRKLGGDLCIANTTEKTGPLFMVTQLVKVLKIYDTVDKAVEGFGQRT
jgi:anti-sigma B factor antagonist